ncbi:hypothetical protein LINGRAHAP2_LOCUS2638 [Linum grandiflorum]
MGMVTSPKTSSNRPARNSG